MPRGIGSLSGLQTLTAFVVGKGSGTGIRELRELQQIQGRLYISQLNGNVSPFDALKANLVGKPGLSELVLEWGGGSEDAKDVLHVLMPYKNLRRLGIKNYGARKFPDWLGNGAFQVLKILHLSNCPNCLHLPPLGQLLTLQHLSISHFDKMETIGLEFYAQGSPPFKSLITLRIKEMSKWRELKDLELPGTFASLEELYLVRCPQLIGDLPRGASMPKRLEIDDCPKLDLASLVNFSGLLSLKLARVNIEPLDLVPLQGLEELDVLHPTAGLLPLCLQLDVPITSLKTACFSSPPETEDNRWSLHYLHIKGEGDSLHFPITSFPQLNYLDFKSGLLDWHGGNGLCLERLYDLAIYGTLHFREEGLCACKLTTLVIHGSDSLEALPKRMRSTLTSLRLLSVDEFNELVRWFAYKPYNTQNQKLPELEVAAERMHSSLASLQSLSIKGYNKLESFPEGGLPASLRTLCIKDCPWLLMNLNNWPLRSLVSLEHLEIGGASNVHLFPERDLLHLFPERDLPTTLTHLCLKNFPFRVILNSSELQRSCSQLEELKISYCKEAKFEAEEHKREIPRSLCSLEIYGSPLLEEWIRRELERNPSKISHLCRINIGGREF
ncbi:hypothetical protein Ancab_029100 [Ancistrocladus abbreviatus]